MFNIDLRGKRAFVAGVADDNGYGFAIAKALAEAGASVCVGTWPPALGIFTKLIERGKIDESLTLSNGQKMAFEKIYPLDADFDSEADVPAETRENKRYKELGDVSIDGLVKRLKADFGDGPCLDIIVHSLANGPEVKKPLLETSRKGYLAAIGVSAYSYTSMVQRLGPLTRKGGAFVALTYMASERVVPGYGGGKAALEHLTNCAGYELADHNIVVNALSPSVAIKTPGVLYYSKDFDNVGSEEDFAEATIRLCLIDPSVVTGRTMGHHEVLDGSFTSFERWRR